MEMALSPSPNSASAQWSSVFSTVCLVRSIMCARDMRYTQPYTLIIRYELRVHVRSGGGSMGIIVEDHVPATRTMLRVHALACSYGGYAAL
jgi:hypothetical protein